MMLWKLLALCNVVACATGQTCPPGEVHVGNTTNCSRCPLATVALNSLECQPCGNASVPNANQTNCSACADGEVPGPNATTCTTCGPGMVPTPARDACMMCPATMVAVFGRTQCSNCSAGTVPRATQTGCVGCTSREYAAEGTAECLECPPGTVSNYDGDGCVCDVNFYPKSDGSCSTCPRGAVCPGQGELPVNQAGFYCQPEFAFFECRTKDVCLKSCQCRELHDPLSTGCEACVEGAYKGPYDDFCKTCPTINLPLLLIGGAVLGVLACLALIAVARKSRAYFPSIAVGVNFVQMVSVLGYLSIPWPAALGNFLDLISLFSLDIRLIHPECAFESTVGVYTRIWFFKMAVPFFILAFFLFCYGVAALYSYWKYEVKHADQEEIHALLRVLEIDTTGKQAKSMKVVKAPWLEHLRDVKYMLINAFLTMCTFVYLGASLTAFEVFVCLSFEKPDGQTVRVLSGDPSITCSLSDSTYVTLIIFGCGGVLLYAFGMPLLFLRLLTRNKHRLGQDTVIAKFGLMYRRYSVKGYYWEITIMARKLVMVFARAFFVDIPILQVVVCWMVATVSYLATKRFRPFVAQHINQLEEVCLFCAAAILATGFAFALGGTSEGEPLEMAGLILALFCIMVWIVAVILVLMMFGRDMVTMRKRQTHGIEDTAATDDLLVLQDFYARKLRIEHYGRCVDVGTDKNPRQQQIRLVVSCADEVTFVTRFTHYPVYANHYFVDGASSHKTNTIREANKGAFSIALNGGDNDEEKAQDLRVAANTIIQKHHLAEGKAGKHCTIIDALLPKPDRYVLEVALCPNDEGELEHVLHVMVDGNDRGNKFTSPRNGETIIIEDAPHAVTVYSPLPAALVPNQAVNFRFYVEGAEELLMERNVRMLGGDTTEMLEVMKRESGMSGADEAELRDLIQTQRRATTTTMAPTQTALERVDGFFFASPTLQVLEGDTFKVIARFSGGEETILAQYEAGEKRVDCEFCELFPASVCCTDCPLYLCLECNKTRHKATGKRAAHNVVPLGRA